MLMRKLIHFEPMFIIGGEVSWMSTKQNVYKKNQFLLQRYSLLVEEFLRQIRNKMLTKKLGGLLIIVRQ